MADAEEIRKSHELTTDKESSKTHRRAVISSDADEEDSSSTSTSTRLDTFLNVVALGNMGAGKSAVLNSILEHQILLTGDYGVTLTPVVIDVSTKANELPVDQKTSHVSADTVKNYLSDKVWKHTSGNNHPEVCIKLHTSNSPPLKLIELPGLDQPFVDASMISKYAQQNDAILLVVVPASQASQISSSQALKIAKEYDPEGTRTVGVIGIMDQAAVLEEHPPGENWKELPPDRRFVLNSQAVAAVEALLSSQGPPETAKIQWIALSPTCLSVSIASAQSGSGENSLETVWRSETESLKSLFAGALESKLGRIALVNTLASKIHSRMKLRLPNILSGLQGKSDQSVQAELEGLYGKLVNSHGGTSAIALELCREIEDKLHFADSEVAPEIIEFELADEEDPHDDFDAVSKNWDIVKNLKTGVFGVVYGSDISYISQSHAPGLRKDEVAIVDRNFRIGETVTRLGDITEQVGIVVAVQKNVILTSIDGNTTTTKVSAADGLERIREYFKDDIVYKGTRIGRVQKTELVTMFVYEDQSELTVLDPLYEPVLTNGLEAMVGEPFYKGQQIVHQDEKGVVKGHWVNRILVKWFDDERTEPPVWVKNKEVRVLLPIRFLSPQWLVGQRCLLDGEEMLITECETSMVSVLWKEGHEEEIASIELVPKDAAKNFLDGGFQISDVVRLVGEVPGNPIFGQVSGVNDESIRVSWDNGSEYFVSAEDIELLDEFPIVPLGEHEDSNSSDEDEDEDEDSNSSDEDEDEDSSEEDSEADRSSDDNTSGDVTE